METSRLISATRVMIVLLFAFALFSAIGGDELHCNGCKTVVNAAHSHAVHNYVNEISKFRIFYHNECNFFRQAVAQGLGGYCFNLYSTHEAQMMAFYKANVPTTTMCANLKQC